MFSLHYFLNINLLSKSGTYVSLLLISRRMVYSALASKEWGAGFLEKTWTLAYKFVQKRHSQNSRSLLWRADTAKSQFYFLHQSQFTMHRLITTNNLQFLDQSSLKPIRDLLNIYVWLDIGRTLTWLVKAFFFVDVFCWLWLLAQHINSIHINAQFKVTHIILFSLRS